MMAKTAKTGLRITASCWLLLSIWACGRGEEDAPPPPPPPPLEALVEAKVLAHRLRIGPRPMIVDSRRHADYLKKHVAGSFSLPLPNLRMASDGSLHEESVAEFNRLLAPSGLRPEHIIVAVDEGSIEGFSRAATTCWLLATAGAGHCLVLDGGIDAWLEIHGPTQQRTNTESKTSSTLRIRSRPPQSARLEEVRRVTVEAGGTVVDVRSAPMERTIPGAVRAPILSAIRPDGRIDTEIARDIALRSGLLLDTEQLALGESLRDGAAGWFLISRVLGIGYVRLFPGGFIALRTYSNLPLVERPLTSESLNDRGLDVGRDRP